MTNLRDMLNKRRDQKRSQQSAAQNGLPIVAPGGQGGIPIKDLRDAIAAMKENDMELIVVAMGSPFNQEVREARLPKVFSYQGVRQKI